MWDHLIKAVHLCLINHPSWADLFLVDINNILSELLDVQYVLQLTFRGQTMYLTYLMTLIVPYDDSVNSRIVQLFKVATDDSGVCMYEACKVKRMASDVAGCSLSCIADCDKDFCCGYACT